MVLRDLEAERNEVMSEEDSASAAEDCWCLSVDSLSEMCCSSSSLVSNPSLFPAVFSGSQEAGTENPGLFFRSLCAVAVLESPSCAVLGSVHASARDSHSLKAQPQKAQCRPPNAHCFKECGCCSRGTC